MTAQILFFCDAKEEVAVIEYLLKDNEPVVFSLDGRKIQEISPFEMQKRPAWPEFICLYIWRRDLGPLNWHTERPAVQGETHRSLVANLFASQDWDQFGLSENDRLLNQELSPAICYKRGETWQNRMGPCTIIAPPSSIDRIGSEYARWVNRNIAWVRRRAKKIHDWKTPTEVIPNPRGLLTTVYAFPSAAKLLDFNAHSFAIL